MGIPTVAITFLPTYAQIGAWAPFLLIMCRFIQGLCAGGEFNGATIFALEHLGNKKPGFIGGAIVAHSSSSKTESERMESASASESLEIGQLVASANSTDLDIGNRNL